jgi:hypothetical protein
MLRATTRRNLPGGCDQLAAEQVAAPAASLDGGSGAVAHTVGLAVYYLNLLPDEPALLNFLSTGPWTVEFPPGGVQGEKIPR